MNKVRIEKAKESEIEEIIAIIRERCVWLEEKNIKQWNKEVYLKKYDFEYFNTQINSQNDLYVAKIDNVIVGVFLLKYKDTEYWNDDKEAIYIHHLATKTNYPNVGKTILKYIEKIAIKQNIEILRLDCVSSNLKLQNYYINNGYELKGTGINANYKFNLYEKKITK